MLPPFLHRIVGSGGTSTSSSSGVPTGGPQRTPLLVPALLDNAARWHGATPVVSLLSDGSTLVRDWRAVRDRAAAFAAGALGAPSALGVRPGDRVATLALNSSAHLEVLYAVAGVGAIHHTLNPRLVRAFFRQFSFFECRGLILFSFFFLKSLTLSPSLSLSLFTF